MKKFPGLVALALLTLPAGAGEAPSGCARLCGTWVLDATRSESAEPVINAALATYKEPKPRARPRPRPNDDPLYDEAYTVPDPAPATRQTGKDALRSRLLASLVPPASLDLGAQDKVILIRTAGTEERRVYPGEPHSRIDAQGTTKISTQWKKGTLIVTESHGRKRESMETFAVLEDGTLQLTRVVERQNLKALQVRAIYRRGETQALESSPLERTRASAP